MKWGADITKKCNDLITDGAIEAVSETVLTVNSCPAVSVSTGAEFTVAKSDKDNDGIVDNLGQVVCAHTHDRTSVGDILKGTVCNAKGNCVAGDDGDDENTGCGKCEDAGVVTWGDTSYPSSTCGGDE